MENKRKWVVERGDAQMKEKRNGLRIWTEDGEQSSCPRCFFLSLRGTEQFSQHERPQHAQSTNFPFQNCDLVHIIYAVTINQLCLKAR